MQAERDKKQLQKSLADAQSEKAKGTTAIEKSGAIGRRSCSAT